MAIALAILCQGYLAVYAKDFSDSIKSEMPDNEGEKMPQDVRNALIRMGWTRTPYTQNIQMNVSYVQEPAWWTKSLGLDTTEKIKEQRDHLKSLWPQQLPSHVSEFYELLLLQKETIKPKVVAECYLAIADRLLGNSISK